MDEADGWLGLDGEDGFDAVGSFWLEGEEANDGLATGGRVEGLAVCREVGTGFGPPVGPGVGRGVATGQASRLWPKALLQLCT